MPTENYKNNPYFNTTGESHPNFGKARDNITKEKISEGASSEIIYRGIRYPSVKVAAIKLNVTETSIRSKLSREKNNPDFMYVEKKVVNRDYSKEMKPILFENVEYKSIKDAADAIGKSDNRVRQIMKEKLENGVEGYKYL